MPVPVKIIGWFDSNVHVEGEVSSGEKVVVKGNERLRPMQKVQIIN